MTYCIGWPKDVRGKRTSAACSTRKSGRGVMFELQRIPECAANDEDLWSILLVCSCLPTHVDFIYTVLYF